MLVELHLLQNFAPSNLNRDDTGAPKSCEFGGFPRARISSQCLKRAIRRTFRDQDLLPADDLAVRTRRIVEDELVPRLNRAGRTAEDARAAVEAMLASVEIALKDDNTQYLLFLGAREIDNLEQVCLDHWDELLAAAGGVGKTKKEKKRQSPKAVTDAVLRSLDGGRAADLALFGRMLADLPEKNRDAASQVAHAISTHHVEVDSDYYTAVDDLQQASLAAGEADDVGAGAGMLGTVEFNSACYYRYANIDTDQLLENLQGDADLARATVHAFLTASVEAIPTGKQNSMAAHNLPSLVLIVVRDRGPQNLANAFARPVGVGRQDDLAGESVRRLDGYRSRVGQMYGADDERGAWFATTEDGEPAGLGERLASVRQVIDRAVGAVAFEVA